MWKTKRQCSIALRTAQIASGRGNLRKGLATSSHSSMIFVVNHVFSIDDIRTVIKTGELPVTLSTLEIEHTLPLRKHAYFRACDRFQLPPAASLVSLATHVLQLSPAKRTSFNKNLSAHTPVICVVRLLRSTWLSRSLFLYTVEAALFNIVTSAGSSY